MERKEGVIRLMNSSGTAVMDSVSVEYEDSFCLDTFGELIEQHQNSEPKGTKNFIIARVQTWDHKQPDKAYYSYYNAFQLNKILFQTQIYLGKKLIHRLRVLNPLTNTDIIGNVNYFIVKGKTSELKNEKCNEVKIDVGMTDINKGKTADMGYDKEECIKTVNLKENDENHLPELTIETASNMEKGIPLKTDNDLKTTSPKKKKPLPKINTSLNNTPTDIIPPSPSVLANEKGGVGSWTIASPAVYECKDEDFPKKVWIKRKLSLLTPSTKTTFNKQRNSTLDCIEENHDEYGSTVGMVQPKEQKIEVSSSEQPTLEHTEITTIPIGTVTQFAKPVPQDQVLKIVPPTIKGRRRSLSYLNTLSATPKNNCSLREWLVYMKKETMKLDEDTNENGEKKDYDSVDLGKENKREEVDITNSKLNTENETKKDDTDVTDIDIEMFDAVLFATDDDFLEKSKIRSIFKKNAITPEDAKLFEMPEYKGVSNSEEAQLILYDDATLCDICFPEPPSNIKGLKAIIYQYRYILLSIVIVGIFIPIYLIK
jgi:hypothetical protein